MDERVFFSNWVGLIRIVIVGVLAYGALVALLRFSGKRTLSKMDAFDLVVTVALGSTLATIILSKDVALVEGVTAFAVLIGLQFILAWLSVRSPAVRQLVKAQPTLLLYQGQFLPAQMRIHRVLEAEILAAIRQQGIGSVDDVAAVVLETDGALAVVTKTDRPLTALNDLDHARDARPRR